MDKNDADKDYKLQVRNVKGDGWLTENTYSDIDTALGDAKVIADMQRDNNITAAHSFTRVLGWKDGHWGLFGEY